MSKQDGYASRTATDLERKYNFGQTFAEVYNLVSDARKVAEEAKESVEGLDQEAIFNLLTNFGEWEGVYRGEDDGVYINASFIKSGTLEGENLKVAAGTVEGELTAATIKADKISGGELDFDKVTAKNLVVGAAAIQTALKASTIEASQIKSGTLDCSLITVKNLSVGYADIQDALSASSISASQITGGTLDFDEISTRNLKVKASQITNLSALYISADNIEAGTLDAEVIELAAGDGGFGVARGYDANPSGGGSTTYGAKVYGSSSDNYLICTGSGVRMQSSNANFFVAGSVIKASTTIETSSDRRAKQDIAYDIAKYRPFLRKLKPCVYRYKSDPYSPLIYGFIAQDVEAALTESGLTRLDFDGVRGGELNEETGEAGAYGLSYSQFIGLLTDAVQDIYSRLEAVENNLGG